MAVTRDLKKNSTIAFARQTSLTTENATASEFSPIACTWEASHDQEQEDFSDFSAGAVGAFVAPAPGSKSGGTLTLSFPMKSLKSGYDPTSESPGDIGVISPEANLLATAMGSGGASSVASAALYSAGNVMSTTDYDAGGIDVGSTTTNIKVTAALSTGYLDGQFIAIDSAAAAGTPGLGWVTNVDTGPTPDEVTVSDALAITPVTGENSYGTAVGWVSGNEPVPLTFWRTGNATEFKFAYIGCVAKSVSINLNAKKTAMIEITFQFADRKRYSSGGGLIAPSSFERVRPTLGNSGSSLRQDGAATCGYHDLSVSLEWEIADVECHGAAQGVSEFVRTLSSANVTATIPYDGANDVITNGNGPAETRYSNGTDIRLMLYVGLAAGQYFSMLFPALHLDSPPQQTEVNGMMATELSMRPSAYTGDTGDAAATTVVDTVIRFGIA
jgi:hypothetical protein